MANKLLFAVLMLLASAAAAYDKILNNYTHNYDFVGVSTAATAAVILASTPAYIYQIYGCSNCTNDMFCVAKSTAAGSQVRISSRTQACQ